MKTLRVLIADDHQILRTMVSTYLRSQPDVEVVGEAADGVNAVRMAHRFRPDIVLLDMNMPRQDGLKASHAIKSRFPLTKVFIVSFQAPEMLTAASGSGIVDGFVAKNSLKKGLEHLLRLERDLRNQLSGAAA